MNKCTSNIILLDLQFLAVGCQELFLDLMTILSKAHIFYHEAGISTICQLKIIEEVKKLVDEMKTLYKCNFNRTNSRKSKQNH